MLPINHLQHYLDDSWKFRRQITHHQTQQLAHVEGTTSWQLLPAPPAQPRHLYLERGVLQIGDYTGAMTQTYQYVFRTLTSADIYFKDGRFFYTLDLTTGQCEFHHLCGEDTYQGQVEVMSKTEYRQTWHVSGPRKDYTSQTIFFRTAPTQTKTSIAS